MKPSFVHRFSQFYSQVCQNSIDALGRIGNDGHEMLSESSWFCRQHQSRSATQKRPIRPDHSGNRRTTTGMPRQDLHQGSAGSADGLPILSPSQEAIKASLRARLQFDLGKVTLPDSEWDIVNPFPPCRLLFVFCLPELPCCPAIRITRIK